MNLFETITFLSVVKCIHVVALCAGFGAALLADITVLGRGILRPVTDKMIETVEMLSKSAAVGLAMLWLTGIVLVGIKLNANPEVMHNEKLWAKVAIVTILTLNGAFIHSVILSSLRFIKGERIFDALSTAGIFVVTFSAALSTASWTLPVVLGVASELNFKVSFVDVFGLYGATLSLLWIGFLALSAIVGRLPVPNAASGDGPSLSQRLILQRGIIPSRDSNIVYERFDDLRNRTRAMVAAN